MIFGGLIELEGFECELLLETVVVLFVVEFPPGDPLLWVLVH